MIVAIDIGKRTSTHLGMRLKIEMIFLAIFFILFFVVFVLSCSGV